MPARPSVYLTKLLISSPPSLFRTYWFNGRIQRPFTSQQQQHHRRLRPRLLPEALYPCQTPTTTTRRMWTLNNKVTPTPLLLPPVPPPVWQRSSATLDLPPKYQILRIIGCLKSDLRTGWALSVWGENSTTREPIFFPMVSYKNKFFKNSHTEITIT